MLRVASLKVPRALPTATGEQAEKWVMPCNWQSTAPPGAGLTQNYRPTMPVTCDEEWALSDAWWQGRAKANTRPIFAGSKGGATKSASALSVAEGANRACNKRLRSGHTRASNRYTDSRPTVAPRR